MKQQVYTNNEMIYMLTQNMSIGGVAIEGLLGKLGRLEDILYIEETKLTKELSLNKPQADYIISVRDNAARYAKEYRALKKRGISYITILDKEYPKRLINIKDKPAGLYVKGKLPDDDVPTAAIVGSRAATNYGINMSHFIANELSRQGIEIISGMAAGIDGASHRGALDAGGCSYGILACGINICYPNENYDIYEAMSGGRGGIISESPLGTAPVRHLFPIRNRIISGLSDVLIVIEARERSGSMITVDHALEQGKEIFVLPGRITDPLSRGCNELIRTGASILTKPADVLEYLNLKKTGRLAFPDKNINFLANNQKVVYSCLDLEPKYAEDIALETNIPLSEVLSILLELELDGYIVQLSSNYYAIKMD